MKQFEYKLFENDQNHLRANESDYRKLDVFLNELGDDGWQLVDYHQSEGRQYMIMMREKKESFIKLSKDDIEEIHYSAQNMDKGDFVKEFISDYPNLFTES